MTEVLSPERNAQATKSQIEEEPSKTEQDTPQQFNSTKPEGNSQEHETTPDEDYSIFTTTQKRFIVALTSLAALFSPLSANIYYSATTTLARDLNTSVANINLTVTCYLVRHTPLTATIMNSLTIPGFPGAISYFHRRSFRQHRPPPCLPRLFRHISSCKYRACPSEELSGSVPPPVHTKLRW